MASGANVNAVGSSRCGRHPLDHAIQHQRLDSVKYLVEEGAHVSLESVLVAIDVTSPQIVELLLVAGAQCAKKIRSVLYWGRPLGRVLSAPLKCPRESYKQLFTLLVQSTISRPLMCTPCEDTDTIDTQSDAVHQNIESEIREAGKNSEYLAAYLYVYLLRNGYRPTESMRTFMVDSLQGKPSVSQIHLGWVEDYLKQPVLLSEACVRVVRSYLYLSGNILYGVKKIQLPERMKDRILLVNPF